MAKSNPRVTPGDPYPPLFIEALSYHEAGHAVLAVLFCVPIKHVALAERCHEPDFNAHTGFDIQTPSRQEISRIKYALIAAASEHSERLSPNFADFKLLHKKYRHLKPFRIGVRNDLIHALNVMVSYQLLGLSESTAKQYFKRDVREPASQLIAANAHVVRTMAEHLRQHHYIDGEQAKDLVLAARPTPLEPLLRQFNIA